MNKDAFLSELERLLYDIPREEREEAMDYYRSYFEDAGAENEAAVIEELESPQQLAAGIKEGLSSCGDMAGVLKNPPQVREGQTRTQQDTGSTSAGSSNQSYQGSSGKAFYKRYDQYDQYKEEEQTGQTGASGRMDKRTKLILLIIAAVFTIPVWGTLVSVVFGIAGAAVAIVVTLGIFSIGGIIGGIVCIITAIAKLCTLSLFGGLFLLAVGLLLVAGSGFSMILLLLLCGKFLPWAAGQITQLFKKLLNWGRSLA